jgi:hypothetical protein
MTFLFIPERLDLPLILGSKEPTKSLPVEVNSVKGGESESDSLCITRKTVWILIKSIGTTSVNSSTC